MSLRHRVNRLEQTLRPERGALRYGLSAATWKVVTQLAREDGDGVNLFRQAVMAEQDGRLELAAELRAKAMASLHRQIVEHLGEDVANRLTSVDW